MVAFRKAWHRTSKLGRAGARGRIWSPVFVFLFLSASTAFGQGLNWEGQTGALVTPFAYTSSSPSHNFGRPQISFHFLNTGPVVGNNIQASATVGFFKRFEFGYTRSIKELGSTPGLSPLFDGGFNIIHGKVNFLPENFGKHNYVPALTFGFVARTQVRHVGGIINNKDTANGDIYLVATKVISQVKKLPLLLNFGVKATNASIFGIAGNAAAWQGRLFGAAGFIVKGPAGSTAILGSEFVQQPHHIQGLPGATVLTTVTYIVRFIPSDKLKLAFDFGVVSAVGTITPGVNINARHQFGTGITYQF